MRGEQLRGGWDVLRADLDVLFQRRENLILLLGNIKLIEPADDLDVPAILIGHYSAHVRQNAFGRQQVLRHQQLGVIGDLLEHERHVDMPMVADGDQQKPIGFPLPVA